MSGPGGDAPPAPLLRLDDVSVTFGRGPEAVRALARTDLSIAPGEFVALVGPSGCGKSTVLRLVGGLARASEGVVLVKGREIGAEPLRIGMAFQNPTLLPWLTVLDNVLLPLRVVPPFRAQFRARAAEFRARAEGLLAAVGLAGQGGRRPWQLSGGMLQRASLCRALVHEPELLMLDEPFGALDQFTREELWGVLQDLWLAHRPTVLLVTHDLKEAAHLADRVLVMRARPGRVVGEEAILAPRPRAVEATFEPEFAALTGRLRAAIVAVRGAGAGGGTAA